LFDRDVDDLSFRRVMELHHRAVSREQIVHAFDAMLEPHGVAVYLQAHHLCVEMRGVRDTSPLTQTTVWRGEYEHNPSLRVEFLLACGAER
jgi:GTP cyclohydrolase IA